jgi:CheY-like chemotaxis protein
VVEDDGGMRKGVRTLLQREGFDVVTAQDGQEALDIFRETKPDLVLADVEMPLVNGFQLCRAIKSIAEFWGGLAVGLGIATQLGALAIMRVISGSMYHHIIKWKSPYCAASGGWEYDLMWFTMCLVIVVTGGGTIAV